MNPVGPRWAKCKYSHDLRGLITHCSNNGKERHKWSWLGSAWWAALMMSWWNNLTIRCVGFYFVCFVSLQILFFKTTFNQIVKMEWADDEWTSHQSPQFIIQCHLSPQDGRFEFECVSNWVKHLFIVICVLFVLRVFLFVYGFSRLFRHEHVLSFHRLPPPAFWVKYGPTRGQTGILMSHGPVSALFLLPGVFHLLE